ncbi:glutamate-rich protein 1 [Otolemur garnettii]|uniref:glutamate-rich protein 1 n=1 Tax=Otolemur garnettii TaxID=30611 RepID=UPI000C7E97D7|nr:glutamate-rich protein 1 [Otolemur garnettii]
MEARRSHVFVEKVLQKLFPSVPRVQEKKELQAPAVNNPPKNVISESMRAEHVQPLTDGDTKAQSGRRLYTVSLPPEGYVPSVPEPHHGQHPENISSSESSEDQDLHDLPKRRRIRKRKSKKNPKSTYIEQAQLEKHQCLLREELQPQHTDGPTISKNKKRKLKKKQQIKRKKAAGLAAKASGVSFMYQPEESSSDREGAGDVEGQVAPEAQDFPTMDAKEPDSTGASEEDATDASEEDVRITCEKTESILKFLKSTQEIYFYDGISKDPDSAVCVETTEELLNHLESRRLPPSDVFILDHMKTLLLLQDIERLRSALEVFPEHCTMPPEHARVITAFFNYWITNVLPESNGEQNQNTSLRPLIFNKKI